MTVGRNDLCPCGSGKKHKKCCLGKPVDCGPCAACGNPSCGAIACKLCGKQYAHCHPHHAAVDTMIRGHVLRTHPEAVPGMVDKLLRSPTELALLEEQHKRNPEMWKRLFDYIDEHRRSQVQ